MGGSESDKVSFVVLSTIGIAALTLLVVSYLLSDWFVARSAPSNPGYVASQCSQTVKPLLPQGQVPSVSPGSHLRYRPLIKESPNGRVFDGWYVSGSVRSENGEVTFFCKTDQQGLITDFKVV